MVIENIDREIQQSFRHNLHRILTKQSLSNEEIAAKIGIKEPQLAALLAGEEAAALSTVFKLAEVFSVSMDTLVQTKDKHLQDSFEVLPLDDVNAQAARLVTAAFTATERIMKRVGNSPTIDSLIAWWKETGGDLSCGNAMSPHFDLVRAAEALTMIPKVHHVGPRGLSATTLGSAENARLEHFLETLSTSDLTELNKNIRNVSHSGVGMITPLTRKVFLQETNETISVSFVRLMLPVKNGSGAPFVLNYSTLLSESTPKSRSG